MMFLALIKSHKATRLSARGLSTLSATSREFRIDSSIFRSAKGKHVVVTGGASGVGREAVTMFAEMGAKVTCVDMDERKGSELVDNLISSGSEALFQKTDVSNFHMLQSSIETASKTLGSSDIVCANAGAHDHEDWFCEDFLRGEHSWTGAKVNIFGTLNTIQLALLSFWQSEKSGSIVVTGSLGGYSDVTPLCVYGGSKHAVVGLFRSFRTVAPSYNSRINLIAPGMIDTGFAGPALDMFKKGNFPINSTRRVAELVASLGLSNDANGKGMIMVGDRIFDAEDGYEGNMETWLGEEASKLVLKSREPVIGPFRKGGAMANLH